MLRKSSPPIEPRRADAPMTATVRGSKNGRSDAVTATWSRSSTRSSYGSVAAIGKSTSTSPPSSSRVARSRRLEDAEHAAVVGHHLRDEALDPVAAGALGELLEQPRADPAPLIVVGDGEGGLGARRDRAAARSCQQRRSARVVLEQASRAAPRARPSPGRAAARRAPGRGGESRGSAGTGSARESAPKNSSSASASSRRGGRSRSVAPSRRITSTTSAVMELILAPERSSGERVCMPLQ